MLIGKWKKLKKYDPKAEEALLDEIEAAGGLEKNDLKAMIIAALVVILPVVLVIFALFVLVAWMFV